MFKKYFNANYNHNKKYRFYLKNSKTEQVYSDNKHITK